MSMGSVGGIVNSAAGAPISQTAGSETERAQKDSLAQHREIDSNQRSERAAGIGQTEQDQESSERDADGRRLWEAPAKRARRKRRLMMQRRNRGKARILRDNRERSWI